MMSKRIALVLLVTFSFFRFVSAQDGTNPDPGGGESPTGFACDPPCPVNYECVDGQCICNNCNIPIDGDIYILIFSGLAIGGFRWMRHQQRA
jgi:hypothetical protein